MPSDLAHTMLQDLGTELCVLVYHLFQGRRPAPEAFVELARRTRKTVDVQESQHVSALADLPRTSWYTEMARCYDGVRRTTMTKHASDFAEVEDLTRDMCPNDCAASSLIDSIQNIVALLTCSISEADLEAFVNHMCEVHRDATSVSTTELIRALSDNLLMDALIPRGWWNNNNNNEVSGVAGPDDEAYACRRVRLRSSPPEMVIEYRDHATIRHRRIDLRDVLHTHGQIGPLARRLAASHGWLLSEADIQRLLIKLQREMQRAESMAEEEVAAGDDDDHHHHRKPAEAAPSSSSSSSIHAQKNNNNDDDAAAATGISSQQADLGLLYRDPELALKNVDLNGADDITVQEFKEVMNHTFLAAVVKPGEEGYQYDKRVEVAPPTQKSEWDDSDEDEDDDDE